jgi:hypothetical protein
MTIATINRFISLFSGAFTDLSVQVPVADLERLAMLIHHSMDHGRRAYHTSAHVLDTCEGMNPRQVLATLFHDIVYYQLDDGFPKLAEALLEPVVRADRDVVEVRLIDGSDKGYTLCTGLFGFKAGQALPLYNGMNEFLSAVVATRTLEPYLPLKDIIAIVACIEATIPFRMADAAGRDMLDVLADRVSEVGQALGLHPTAAEIDRVVTDAAVMSNRDLASFSEADPGRFLSMTWLLIEESNAPLAAVGIYSIQEYRGALSRMEKFLGSLNPDSIFQSYRGTPGKVEFGVLRAAARRNVEFACTYLGMKIVGIALVEALALATGGDCPVSMLLGDIRSPYGKPDRVEDFLPPVPADESNLDTQLLEVLEKGRAIESASDLTDSPIAAFSYRSLGAKGAEFALEQAKKMFVGELTARAFLGGLDREMVRALTQACARIALSRTDALLALGQSI